MVPVQQLISYTLKDVCFNSLFPGQPGLTDLHILITRFCRLCAVSDANPTNSFFPFLLLLKFSTISHTYLVNSGGLILNCVQ